MAIQVKTEVIDVKIDNYNSLKCKCTKFDPKKDKILQYDQKGLVQYLKFYTSIIGEESPSITDLPINYIGEITKSYRYDWSFGLSCIPEVDNRNVFWDWKSKLRENNSVKIQLFFEPQSNDSSLFFNIISANLLCLTPSKNTNSWYKKKEGISDSLKSIANITKDYSKIASDVFNVANMLTNFIAPDDNGQNWYLYKFLDQERNCFAIEWHINKRVLDQFGPMLQGSLVLNFHGSANLNEKMKLRIRPSISFTNEFDLCYVSPYESLEFEHFIEISPK